MNENLVKVIAEMKETAFRLRESSKTPQGQPSYTTVATANRRLAYDIDRWAHTLTANLK